MKYLLIALTLTSISGPVQVQAQSGAGKQCSSYCNPEKSKPCGKGCIRKGFTCRKSWTTACVGVRSASASSSKPGYDNPKHVNKPPSSNN